ncbi:MAG: heparinase [Candidatus Latescibacteria bacterium]|nr:heparinase [Candidatus Latescibacterota bacterium]
MMCRFFVFLSVVWATSAFAQPNLLQNRFTSEQLTSLVASADDWKPFPKAADRAAWAALPEDFRKRAIKRGESALDFDWPALPADVFLDFARNGNRSRYQTLRGRKRSRLRDLVLAECVEGEGRFLDQIVNGVWATCEETWWGVPAHVGRQKAGKGLPDVEEPVVALFSAETSAQLAWTVYLLEPQLNVVSPLIVPRIQREIDRQILTPMLTQRDYGWMGMRGNRVNNWNPWICSNWLTSVLIMEKDAERRAQSVSKILRVADNFLNQYPKDGGCDEGPGYWGRAGASLFDCLELMHSATNGQFDVYDNTLIQEMGRFIYRAHIDGSYRLNFADASARGGISASLVYNYGKRIGDDTMMKFGAWSAEQRKGHRGNVDEYRDLYSLFHYGEIQSVKGTQPYLRDVWLPDLQVFVAREEEGVAKGFYVAGKGGHNAESHNHNDVGSFVVYRDGLPILIDAGVGTYSAKTFSRNRYDIWTMQSAYHNLPTINGVMQQNGRKFAAKDVAYKKTNKSATFSLDLVGAYPKEAGIQSWQRAITLNRGKSVEIRDRYVLDKVSGDMILNLMTACDVSVLEPGKLMLKGDGEKFGSATVVYDAEMFEAATEAIALDDRKLSRSWQTEQLTRIVLKAKSPSKKDTWTVSVKP